MKNVLSNIERIKKIRNHTSIHVTLIISVLNVTAGNQIRDSDVDQRIISLQIFRNWTFWKRNFTGTLKRIKLVRTDQQKYIRRRKIVQIKAIHGRYTRL